MSKPDYEKISIGSSIEAIQLNNGPPYSISILKDGTRQYRYIERIEIAPGTISQNTFILTVMNGQIIDKQCLNDSQVFNLKIR